MLTPISSINNVKTNPIIPHSESRIPNSASIPNYNINAIPNSTSGVYKPPTTAKVENIVGKSDEIEFRELFHKFIGQVLFGQMLKSMRATQQKNPYFHGGRAEEIFQDELDNKLVEQLTTSTTKNLSEPMYNQFKRQQNQKT
ncbi:MAG: rod-binding protein [Planctomycetaceae bacterium]|jgi:hypothetical protein|nr:rod-binding protein [Planctomycetaceae bacterium]